jgi:hypothetical protein
MWNESELQAKGSYKRYTVQCVEIRNRNGVNMVSILVGVRGGNMFRTDASPH